MKKKILTLVLGISICLIVFLLGSCNENDPLNNTDNDLVSPRNVKMLGIPDGNIFHKTVETYDLSDVQYQNVNADVEKNIVIAKGNTEKIMYQYSTKNDITDLAVYENSNISCYFDSKTDRMLQIFAKNNSINIPDSVKTEADYRAWIEQLLSSYDVGNLSDYNYSCQTSVIVSSENGVTQNQLAYFYTDVKSNERVSRRVFTYTRYISGYPTTDRIYISISPITGSVIIKFDERDFANYSFFSCDETQIISAVDSYIFSSINTELYEVSSSNIVNRSLVMIENEAGIMVDVELKLCAKEASEPFDMVVTLVVFPQ